MTARPAPGSLAAQLSDLIEQERSLSVREASLVGLEGQSQERAGRLRARLDASRSALGGLTAPFVAAEAEQALAAGAGLSAPEARIGPEMEQVLALRRKAAAARAELLEREEAGLRLVSRRLDEAELGADKLEAQAAALAMKLAEEEARLREEERRRVEEEARKKAEEERQRRRAEARARAEERRRKAADGAGGQLADVVRLEAELTPYSESNFFAGFGGDLAEAGVFVATWEQSLSLGTSVDLVLTVPGRPPMELTGVVKWVRDTADPMSGIPPGMGVVFDWLDEDAIAAIQSFAKEREPIFWAE